MFNSPMALNSGSAAILEATPPEKSVGALGASLEAQHSSGTANLLSLLLQKHCEVGNQVLRYWPKHKHISVIKGKFILGMPTRIIPILRHAHVGT